MFFVLFLYELVVQPTAPTTPTVMCFVGKVSIAPPGCGASSSKALPRVVLTLNRSFYPATYTSVRPDSRETQILVTDCIVDNYSVAALSLSRARNQRCLAAVFLLRTYRYSRCCTLSPSVLSSPPPGLVHRNGVVMCRFGLNTRPHF